uniref:Uncharacterized protein n=1 Tax=Oryza meridionalis TaxID=40149 RepID=A0A0E0DQY7_9ORYZ
MVWMRYPLDLLLINEYGGSSSGRCVAWAGGSGVCLRTGGDVLRGRGIDEGMSCTKLFTRWCHKAKFIGVTH